MNRSNRDLLPGETMFEMLQRKKRHALTQKMSAQSPRPSLAQTSATANNQNRDYNRPSPSQLSKGQTRSEGVTGNTTPTRSQQQEERSRPVRSFLQMISPLRRSVSPLRQEEGKEPEGGSRGVSPRRKKDREQNYTRKVVVQKIGEVREGVERMIKTGGVLRDKTRLLLVELKPMLRQLQKSGVEGRMGEVWAAVRGVDGVLKQAEPQTTEQSISAFELSFSQYMNELEGLRRTEVEEQREEAVSRIVQVKDSLIQQLREEVRRMKKELAHARKQAERAEEETSQVSRKLEAELDFLRSNSQGAQGEWESQLVTLQEQRNRLQSEKDQLSVSLQESQERVKKLNYDLQSKEQEWLNELTKVKSEQQDYLLAQIITLKKEFNTDITQLTHLHQLQLQQTQAELADHKQQLMHQQQKYENVLKRCGQMEESMGALQAQGSRLRKQNECMATDMHRINEELYQHWVALKDVQTLTMRLGTFPHIRNIYDELPFNPQLFL